MCRWCSHSQQARQERESKAAFQEYHVYTEHFSGKKRPMHRRKENLLRRVRERGGSGSGQEEGIAQPHPFSETGSACGASNSTRKKPRVILIELFAAFVSYRKQARAINRGKKKSIVERKQHEAPDSVLPVYDSPECRTRGPHTFLYACPTAFSWPFVISWFSIFPK
jgi:hypothetical protein